MKIPFRLSLIAPVFAGLIFLSPAIAQFDVLSSMPPSPLPQGVIEVLGDTVDNVFLPRAGGTLATVPGPSVNLGGFDIVIAPGATLASNPAALAAFNRAARAWESRISDPITITINADLASLSPGVIGNTSSVTFQASYDTIRNQLVADTAADLDDAITVSLPTSSQFVATLPNGTALSGMLLVTKANLKAMGFGNVDAALGVTDATISFNTNFNFDFDNSDGVGAGMMDFETVATHEIGHALGFVSIVDSVNGGDVLITPFALDLFRFANNTGDDPGSAADFATFARNLVPGGAAITDQIFGPTAEWSMSTGILSTSFSGTDGRQASHWKADELTGQYLGIMDPTPSFGIVQALTDADFRAMDLIGYDIAFVPELSTSAFGIFAGLAGIVLPRRRSGAARRPTG